jgi:5-methyltetrahydrofolate--homocysteine methyltransferase
MTIDALRARLALGPLVLDGAMSTFLHASSGMPGPVRATDNLVVLQPERVRAVHDAYYEAGADIARTNTFRAAAREHAGHARDVCRAAARLARAAADEWSTRTPGRPRLVAGAVGPADAPAAPSLHFSDDAFEQLRHAFREPLRGLLEGGVDLLLFETWWCSQQTDAALAALADATAEAGRRVPLIVSAALARDGRVAASGAGVADWLRALDPAAVDGVGLNCGEGPGGLEPPLSILRGRFELVCCAPSAGVPGDDGHYPHRPDEFASQLAVYLRAGVAQIVGGCCGTTPAHVRALATAAAACGGGLSEPPNAIATPRRAGAQ